ncbi:MAG: hypothetical protein HKM04_11740 [Legionellales bacterium]|nr:hypothetical protein [Legionellales bacterium]
MMVAPKKNERPTFDSIAVRYNRLRNGLSTSEEELSPKSPRSENISDEEMICLSQNLDNFLPPDEIVEKQEDIIIISSANKENTLPDDSNGYWSYFNEEDDNENVQPDPLLISLQEQSALANINENNQLQSDVKKVRVPSIKNQGSINTDNEKTSLVASRTSSDSSDDKNKQSCSFFANNGGKSSCTSRIFKSKARVIAIQGLFTTVIAFGTGAAVVAVLKASAPIIVGASIVGGPIGAGIACTALLLLLGGLFIAAGAAKMVCADRNKEVSNQLKFN